MRYREDMLDFFVFGVALVSLYFQYKTPLTWQWWAVLGVAILQWICGRALRNTPVDHEGMAKFWSFAQLLSTVALIGCIVALFMN